MSRKEQIETMLRDEPNDPELHYMLAMEHVSTGDDAQAAERFDELLRIAPQYAPAYHMAGRTLLRLNRVEEAKSLLARGIPVALAQGNSHAAGEMQEVLESID